ncbi:5-oxoprolinase subunit PxpB [Psychrobacillus sp. FSL W7-1457]|uniref:5-oxoprolinase subunit PxpB n=1 Tax=Psychrobacillus sp. FSL W7-1457 TaxID=2954547 RepID=UPI00315A45CE
MTIEMPTFFRTGERTLRFSFKETISQEVWSQVHFFAEMVSLEWNHLIEEVVPSYHTITVFFIDSSALDKVDIKGFLFQWQHKNLALEKMPTRLIHIPVCYEEPYSLDMDRIASLNGLSSKQIIQLHTQPLYTVYMIGFLPGFPYLGELHKSLCISRLDKPRSIVPKGSVGIGGNQTGIYPLESPGGWNIIGRTPLELYSAFSNDHFLLRARDLIRFFPISIHEYEEIASELKQDSLAMKRFVEELSK